MYKFRVLSGLFRQSGKTYRPGDTVEAKANLAEMFNKPGCVKFQLLGESPEPLEQSMEVRGDDLDSKTVEDLRQLAEASEIDLGKARSKADIVAVLRANL